MNYHIVIPARYASTRLPAKPLLDIAGKPMIQHVWERASQAGMGEVIIATDDERIRAAAQGFGARVVLTSAEHRSGTDRLAQVVELCGFAHDDIVINVQGDEPLIPPEVIRQVGENLAKTVSASVATLSTPILDAETLLDPNAVKVVSNRHGYALYFSRAPIPWNRDAYAKGEPLLHGHQRHLGIYAYRAAFLRRYVHWQAAPTELLESLEQLRVLHEGEIIHVAEALSVPPTGVDTEADLMRVRAILAAS